MSKEVLKHVWQYHEHGIATVNGTKWDVWFDHYDRERSNVAIVRYQDGSVVGVYLKDLNRPKKAKRYPMESKRG